MRVRVSKSKRERERERKREEGLEIILTGNKQNNRVINENIETLSQSYGTQEKRACAIS